MTDVQRVKNSEKAREPDKNKIIGPLSFEVAGVADNYSCRWSGTFLWPDGEIGAWSESPKGRSHTAEFLKRLDELRKDHLLPYQYEDDVYYFKHEEGIEAADEYMNQVLAGQRRAHPRSWKNRFEQITGVDLQYLQNEFPDLYTKKKNELNVVQHAPEKRVVEVVTEEVEEPKAIFEDQEPDVEELKRIERDNHNYGKADFDLDVEEILKG